MTEEEEEEQEEEQEEEESGFLGVGYYLWSLNNCHITMCLKPEINVQCPLSKACVRALVQRWQKSLKLKANFQSCYHLRILSAQTLGPRVRSWHQVKGAGNLLFRKRSYFSPFFLASSSTTYGINTLLFAQWKVYRLPLIIWIRHQNTIFMLTHRI